MKVWKKITCVLIISSILAVTVYVIYNTYNKSKAERLYQEYLNGFNTETLTTNCYGYLRLGENECFAWMSSSGEQVCGIRSTRTEEEQIYYNGMCFSYDSLESEPEIYAAFIPYEETMSQITKMIRTFSEEMVLSPSLYHRTFFIDGALPYFWRNDSQLLELNLSDRADSFIPEENSWSHIVLYSNGSSLFTYNLTPYGIIDHNDGIFLAIGR